MISGTACNFGICGSQPDADIDPESHKLHCQNRTPAAQSENWSPCSLTPQPKTMRRLQMPKRLANKTAVLQASVWGLRACSGLWVEDQGTVIFMSVITLRAGPRALGLGLGPRVSLDCGFITRSLLCLGYSQLAIASLNFGFFRCGECIKAGRRPCAAQKLLHCRVSSFCRHLPSRLSKPGYQDKASKER